MFEKLLLAITVTFSLNYFLGIPSIRETAAPSELQTAQTQVVSMLTSAPWHK